VPLQRRAVQWHAIQIAEALMPDAHCPGRFRYILAV
jgi:hypothetical protein